MKACDAFFLKNVKIEGGHPWIVVCNPVHDRLVILNLTDWQPNKDQSCVLEAGCETVITKRSIVSYRDAKIRTDSGLETLAEAGEINTHDPISQETLDRILEGCAVSRYIPQGAFGFLDELGLIPVV